MSVASRKRCRASTGGLILESPCTALELRSGSSRAGPARKSAAGTTAACRRRPCRGEVPSATSGRTSPPAGGCHTPPSPDNSPSTRAPPVFTNVRAALNRRMYCLGQEVRGPCRRAGRHRDLSRLRSGALRLSGARRLRTWDRSSGVHWRDRDGRSEDEAVHPSSRAMPACPGPGGEPPGRHLSGLRQPVQPSGLRRVRVRGCCESQLGHDRDHAMQTGHSVIRSLPLSMYSFTWCYACRRYL